MDLSYNFVYKKLFTVFLLLLVVSGTLSIVKANPGDTLVILHPHSADFADSVIEDFKDWYNDTYGTTISVSQIRMDSGACYSQVRAWGGAPDADVMWGGGEYYFISLSGKGLLENYTVTDDANINDTFGGWPLKDPDGYSRWYAAALSGFGIMWNEEYLTANDLTAPETWEDLTKPEYHGHIVMCDPAKSGSTTFIVIMVTQHFIVEKGWNQNATGWEDAWEYWTKLAGNVGLFTESSHAVPTKVVTGEYGIGIVIDYYAWEQITAGEDIDMNYGKATSISADPAGILKGAPHLKEAKRWMDYITSKHGQEAVGEWRMPIRIDATPTPPVLSAWYNASLVPVIPSYNRTIHNSMFSVTREMFSYWLVKNHEEIKSAWEKILECEDLGLEVDADYLSAIDHYTMLPNATDTLTKALAVTPADEAAGWETWGDTHFGVAKTSAQTAIDRSIGAAARSRTYMYIGIGVVIVVIIAAVYLFFRRK